MAICNELLLGLTISTQSMKRWWLQYYIELFDRVAAGLSKDHHTQHWYDIAGCT